MQMLTSHQVRFSKVLLFIKNMKINKNNNYYIVYFVLADFMLGSPLSSCKKHKTEDPNNPDPVFPPGKRSYSKLICI